MKTFHRSGIFLLSLVAMLMLLASCSSAPTVGHAEGVSQPVAPYTIGPGDTLQIYVRDNPKLSITVPVRPDGRISIPLVQNIMAAGKTPDQLASDLEKALGKYIRSPLVTVIVKGFVGTFSQQVRVVGQAVKPKAVPYRHGMTLLDVLIEVGGLTQFANGNGAKIVRTLSDGKKVSIPVRLGDLMEGDVKYNLYVRPGDILIIPESTF